MSLYSKIQPSLIARMIKSSGDKGLKGTTYEDGIFRGKFFILSEFPQLAPKGYILTKIFQSNISKIEKICVNTLKRDWNPKQWSLFNLFEVIKFLLIVSFPQSFLNKEARKIFMDNNDKCFKVAKMYREIYSKKKETKKEESNNEYPIPMR